MCFRINSDSDPALVRENQRTAAKESNLRGNSARRLDELEQGYAMLRMQSQELAVRNGKRQVQMNMAA